MKGRNHRYVVAIVSALVFFMVRADEVQAQQGPPEPEKQEAVLDRMMTRMTEKVSLSEDQAAQIREIMADQMKVRRERFEAHQEAMRNMREQMQSVGEKEREETNRRVEEILNEDQIESYREFVKDLGRRGRRGERGMRRGPRWGRKG